jgi:hypothetical protein
VVEKPRAHCARGLLNYCRALGAVAEFTGDNEVRFFALPSALFALLVTVQAAHATSNSANCNIKTTIFAACIVSAATVTMANGTHTIPVKLTMNSASKIATGGNNLTTITGKIVVAVINPAVGTYTVAQAIYVLY